MTDGHRHRHVRLPLPVVRLLVRPLLRTSDASRAYHSRFAWRAEPDGDGGTVYRLSALGVLHPLTGLTVKSSEPKV